MDATTALGEYAAERDVLMESPFDILMRVDPDVPTITAEINTAHMRMNYTVWHLPDDQPRRAIESARTFFHKTHGIPLNFDVRLDMYHPLWLAMYAIWRDHFTGSLPSNWPFKSRQAS